MIARERIKRYIDNADELINNVSETIATAAIDVGVQQNLETFSNTDSHKA